jgi:nitronate monooxygenase
MCVLPNSRFIKLSGVVELPIVQAPMAGSALSDMVVAVSQAGGLGSLACALLSVENARYELETIRRTTSRPINANFFCHQPPREGHAQERNWIHSVVVGTFPVSRPLVLAEGRIIEPKVSRPLPSW